jgi:hypothetical protein
MRRSILLLTAFLLAGCSLVPNMDHGTSGCSNAVGIGPRDQMTQAEPAMAELIGMGPAEAALLAVGQGHTVVFNVPIEGYGECGCVPPPEGEVTEAFWTSNGALMLMIAGVDEGHTADQQPPTGWGCP